MMKDICTIKTIDDMIHALEEQKKKLGGDAAVIMSRDEEGNEYADVLMFEVDNANDMAYDDGYRNSDDDDAAVKVNNKNKNVLIIFPNM